MPTRITIKVAKKVAEETGCLQVILLAWDGKLTHCTTYGTTMEGCHQAAIGGDRIKKFMNWPDSTITNHYKDMLEKDLEVKSINNP